MQPSRAVYQALSAIIYPRFLAKIQSVEGAEHLPKHGGFLLAANHVDWLDGFFIAAAIGRALDRPVFFLTKTNNYWWTTLTIQIPPTDNSAIIDTAVTQLKRGRIICNFPEGTRNTGTTLAPGKTGTARMAMMAGVPVVPLGISCDAGKTMAQSLLFLATSGHQATLRFGPPLSFQQQNDPTVADVQSATDTIMQAIAPLARKSFTV